MGQHGCAVDVQLVLDRDVITENGDVLDSSPSTDAAIPTDDGAGDPSMITNDCVAHDDTSLKTSSWSDLGTWSDNDVRANQCRRIDLGRWVHKHVAAIHPLVLRRIGQEGRVGRGKVREVEASSGQVVFRLTYVHPESLQIERMQLLVGSDGGEDLLFDRGRSKLDSIENGRVEDVDTGVNPVTDELDRFLNESVDQ